MVYISILTIVVALHIQPVETSAFEVIYRLDVKNEKNTVYKKNKGKKVDDIEGFALWYLNHMPAQEELNTAFGYKPDFNGVGVYVFKHRNEWRIQSIFNTGLEGLSVETAVNNLSTYYLSICN